MEEAYEDHKNSMWEEKLKALMKGLEIENTKMLLGYGGIGDYRRLGELMAKRTKLLKSDSANLGILRRTYSKEIGGE